MGSRLRAKRYLPLSQRPEVIETDTGKKIAVDKVMVEGNERVTRRGQAS